MDTTECDVIVVGSGLSGLACSSYMLEKDRSIRVMVLEAKGRIGGRILTEQLEAVDGTKDFWDLGGEWVGRPQKHIHHLLSKFKLDMFNPVKYTDGFSINNTQSTSIITWLDIVQFSWKLKLLIHKFTGQRLHSGQGNLLDDINFKTYCKQNLWTNGGHDVVEAACRCMFGLSTGEITLLYFLMYMQTAGGIEVFNNPSEFSGKECRIKGGVQQLTFHLAQFIGCNHIRLSEPVISITQAFWADSSPGSQCCSFQRVLKHSDYGPVAIVYDASSSRGNPALAGFISYPEVFTGDVEQQKRTVFMILEDVLGDRVHQYIDFRLKDWSQEPYNGGCFLKSLMPGTTKYFNNVLRAPADRIHFAGTETATVWCGFMNGAVQAGYRAATECLYYLRPHITAKPDPDPDSGPNDGAALFPRDSHSVSVARQVASMAIGAAIASILFFLIKSDRCPRGGVQHTVRLVLDRIQAF